jgi:hypothetical protein
MFDYSARLNGTMHDVADGIAMKKPDHARAVLVDFGCVGSTQAQFKKYMMAVYTTAGSRVIGLSDYQSLLAVDLHGTSCNIFLTYVGALTF